MTNKHAQALGKLGGYRKQKTRTKEQLRAQSANGRAALAKKRKAIATAAQAEDQTTGQPGPT